MAATKRLQQIQADLQNLIDIQCEDGTWNYDPYLHGMANGLIMAMSVIKGNSPEFLDPPEQFLRDIEELDKFNKSSVVLTQQESE